MPICAPTKVDLKFADVVAQFRSDTFGKEVQNNPTYSYVWLADQMGHVGLGLFFFSVVFLVVDWFGWNLHIVQERVIACVVCAVAFAIFEARTLRAAFRDATASGSAFPIDRTLLLRNATVAWLYMALGAVIALLFTFPFWFMITGLIIAIALAIVASLFWLKQKIVWQRADIPYVFRLADAVPPPAAGVAALNAFLTNSCGFAASTAGQCHHLLIGGPLGKGKSTLAAGIATELAFKNVKVRFVTLQKLLQLALSSQEPPAPRGLEVWPWTECQVLIVDDVDPGIPDKPLFTPAEFQELMERYPSDLQPCLRLRCTVWVLGTHTAVLPAWKDALAHVLGDDRIATVALE